MVKNGGQRQARLANAANAINSDDPGFVCIQERLAQDGEVLGDAEQRAAAHLRALFDQAAIVAPGFCLKLRPFLGQLLDRRRSVAINARFAGAHAPGNVAHALAGLEQVCRCSPLFPAQPLQAAVELCFDRL